jgi:hypothetical protein
MPGVNCGRLHRLVRRPAEIEKGQGDAAKRLFFLGREHVRGAALAVIGVWRPQKGQGSTATGRIVYDEVTRPPFLFPTFKRG